MDVDGNNRLDPTRKSAPRYHDLYREGFQGGRSVCPASCRFYFGELTETNSALPFFKVALRVPAGTPADSPERLRTHGLAWHPYQHRTNPENRPSRRSLDKHVVGIGRLGDIRRALRDAADDNLLRTPGRNRPRLYLTEFGYFNRRNPDIRRDRNTHFHREARRADWFPRALDEAVEHKARMFLLYHGYEAPPKDYDADCSVKGPLPRVAQWDSGLLGAGGAVTGKRCYGRPPRPPYNTVDNPQDREAYCAIWKWTYYRSYHATASTAPGCRP